MSGDGEGLWQRHHSGNYYIVISLVNYLKNRFLGALYISVPPLRTILPFPSHQNLCLLFFSLSYFSSSACVTHEFTDVCPCYRMYCDLQAEIPLADSPSPLLSAANDSWGRGRASCLHVLYAGLVGFQLAWGLCMVATVNSYVQLPCCAIPKRKGLRVCSGQFKCRSMFRATHEVQWRQVHLGWGEKSGG